MRIFDQENDKALKSVILYLKLEEAKELLNDLKDAVEKNDVNFHAHVNDDEYAHEITLLIYDEKNIEPLNERSKKLIKQDIWLLQIPFQLI